MTETTTFVPCEACTVDTMPECHLCKGSGIVDAATTRNDVDLPTHEDAIGFRARKPKPKKVHGHTSRRVTGEA